MPGKNYQLHSLEERNQFPLSYIIFIHLLISAVRVRVLDPSSTSSKLNGMYAHADKLRRMEEQMKQA